LTSEPAELSMVSNTYPFIGSIGLAFDPNR